MIDIWTGYATVHHTPCKWHPRPDLNRCCSLERAVTLTAGRRGHENVLSEKHYFFLTKSGAGCEGSLSLFQRQYVYCGSFDVRWTLFRHNIWLPDPDSNGEEVVNSHSWYHFIIREQFSIHQRPTLVGHSWIGVPDRIWTGNIRGHNPVIYQLNYGHHNFVA